MRTFLLASLRTHLRRYVAVAVAVLIATTFMVATNLFGTSARDGWRDTIAAEFQGADLVLTDVRRGTADRVRALDGVAAVSRNDTTFMSVTTGSLRTTASVGTVADATSLRWQDLTGGRFPRRPGEVLIAADRAGDAGVGVGDSLSIDDGSRTRKLTIAGVVKPSGGDLGSSVYLTERTMAQVAGGTPPFRLVVSLADTQPASAQTVRAAAAGATVQGVDAYVRDLQLGATGDIDLMQRMLFVFVSIALLVAALVIANTLSIVFAQRTRDFALLRCVGALRRQILRSTLAEATAVAVAASLAGVPLALGVAYAGTGLLEGAWPGVSLAEPRLTLAGTAIPVLVSVAVAVAAAIVPARRVNRVAPLAALRPEPDPGPRDRPGVLRLVAASGLLVAGVGALAVGATSGSLPLGMGGGGLSFLGVLLLGPILVPALIGAVRPLAGRVAGVPGRLAAANAVRHRRRTAATSAALLIGVTLISTVIVGTASMKSSVATEMDTRAPVDMVLEAEHPVDDALAGQIRRIDGVRDAAPLDGARVELGGRRTSVVGVDDGAREVVRPDGELRELGAGRIVVPADSAGGLNDGDEVRVAGSAGSARLTVTLGSGFGSSAVVSAATLERLDGRAQPSAVWLRADDDADVETVVGELNTLADDADASIDGSLPERASIMSALDIVLAVTVGLLGVAALIAVIGVGNTLSLSVLERVRENALLRALGLRRRQQRTILAVEALLIAGVAGLLGVGLGLGYAWFGVRTLAAQEFVTSPALDVPVGQLLVVLAVAAVAGLLACVLPARRAVRIPPAAGLAAD